LTAAGLSSFAWAGWASRVVSPATSQFSQLVADVLPVGGWRIYDLRLDTGLRSQHLAA
jgi:hypothetical protein